MHTQLLSAHSASRATPSSANTLLVFRQKAIAISAESARNRPGQARRKCPHVFTPGTPAVGAAAASCQVHEMGVGGLLLRFAWPAAALAYKGLARDSNTTQSRVAWVGWLHTGCQRACAPPSTLLGRLQRVVLPVKRDRSPGNPNTPGDYSSCAPEE